MAIRTIFAKNRALKQRHLFEIRVEPEGISRSSPILQDLFLPRTEIIGFSEVKRRGLKIQTSRPQYFIMAPQDLDDLLALREELGSLGIPLIDAPKENWAKTILFVACFVLGGLLGGFAQNRILATCGWVVLAAAFLWGLLEARGNPNVSRRTMRPLSVAILLLLIVCGIFWVWHR